MSWRARDHEPSRREWHDATCAACKQPTQVPFKPREGKPVYCRDCHALYAP